MALSSVVEPQSDDIEDSYGDEEEDSVDEGTQDGVVVSYEDTAWGGSGYHRVVTVENITSQSLSN